MNVSHHFRTPSQSRNAPASQTWSAERVELLKRYVRAGFTCLQIAREIGVTRNAVIGKLNRLGLSRPSGSARAAARPQETNGSRMRRPRPIKQRGILRTVFAEAPPAAAEATEPAVPSADRCTLLELAYDKCRWPISEPDAKDFSFCGNPAVAGLSYCAGHARIAYRTPARRRA
jgi:GcrA cell cycle regulator